MSGWIAVNEDNCLKQRWELSTEFFNKSSQAKHIKESTYIGKQSRTYGDGFHIGIEDIVYVQLEKQMKDWHQHSGRGKRASSSLMINQAQSVILFSSEEQAKTKGNRRLWKLTIRFSSCLLIPLHHWQLYHISLSAGGKSNSAPNYNVTSITFIEHES